jgi:hypothetical protein
MSLSCLIFITCNGTSPVAGGTSTAENGRIYGTIKNQSGTPVPMVKVQLFNAAGNPLRGDKAVTTKTTNENGEYLFDSILPGSYTIQSIDQDRNSGAIHFGIISDKDTVAVAPDILNEFGALECVFTNKTVDSNWYVYIPGTSYFAYIKNKLAILDSIPAGLIYAIRIGCLTDTSKENLVVNNITIFPRQKSTILDSTFWKYSKKLFLNTTYDGADVIDTVTDFPVLIRLSSSNFTFDQAKSDGSDILFTKKDGTPLLHEIERWDGVARKAELWVKIDTVYGRDSIQYLNMHWGGTPLKITGNSVFDTANKFIAVWHMSETPYSNSASVKDYTINAHNAQPYGSMSSVSVVDGVVGKALRFDGIDDYLNAGNVSITNTYSIGLWVQVDTNSHHHRFIYKDSSYTMWYDRDTGCVRFEHFETGKWWRGIPQNGGARVPLSKSEWRYFVGTFDGMHFRLYADGKEVSMSDVYTAVPNTSGAPLLIGKIFDTSYMQGIMDEIRIEGTARSSSWIKLCYMNQKSIDVLVHY